MQPAALPRCARPPDSMSRSPAVDGARAWTRALVVTGWAGATYGTRARGAHGVDTPFFPMGKERGLAARPSPDACRVCWSRPPWMTCCCASVGPRSCCLPPPRCPHWRWLLLPSLVVAPSHSPPPAVRPHTPSSLSPLAYTAAAVCARSFPPRAVGRMWAAGRGDGVCVCVLVGLVAPLPPVAPSPPPAPCTCRRGGLYAHPPLVCVRMRALGGGGCRRMYVVSRCCVSLSPHFLLLLGVRVCVHVIVRVRPRDRALSACSFWGVGGACVRHHATCSCAGRGVVPGCSVPGSGQPRPRALPPCDGRPKTRRALYAATRWCLRGRASRVASARACRTPASQRSAWRA